MGLVTTNIAYQTWNMPTLPFTHIDKIPDIYFTHCKKNSKYRAVGNAILSPRSGTLKILNVSKLQILNMSKLLLMRVNLHN